MPPVNVLIKPASSACNMICNYCFYKDVSSLRHYTYAGILSYERLESLIKASMEYAEHICSFTFQGGEPTLVGIEFYRRLIELQTKYARPGVKVFNAIQSNGYSIDLEWAKFLSENQFLVGLSIDGPAELHNLNRHDTKGKDTFNRVMKAAHLLKKYGAAFNILCVVTGRNARSVEKIYNFFVKNGFNHLQFIPCIEPFENTLHRCNLTDEEYADFLIRLFDLWYYDLRRGNYVSIRHLDNWLCIMQGYKPESCDMVGQCSIQFVVEGNGSVYPCDFYVLDEYCIGTIDENDFFEMSQNKIAKQFIEASLYVPEHCRACQWYTLCRNGCRRDRLSLSNETPGLNRYCKAYKKFFAQRYTHMLDAITLLKRA